MKNLNFKQLIGGMFLMLFVAAIQASAKMPETSVGPCAEADQSFESGIVGFWSVKFVAFGTTGIPDGTVIDDAYVVWHSDGTEIMNSARPPLTSSFCMGVWKQTSQRRFKLNHFAKSWDPSGTTFVGPANIREEVVLDRDGDSYRGTFTIDQYDTNGNVLAHLAGKVIGTRITVD